MSLFRTRRSLKPLAMDPSRPIPREIVADLLEDACWAPTHGLTQPWRFHVFATPSARALLAETLRSIYDAITPPARHDPAKRAKLDAAPRHAPLVLALLARVQPDGKIPEWEEIAATSCAAQNILLSAHQRDIGSFWSSPPAACSADFARWLGHDPATHRALGLIYLGHAQADQPPPRSTRASLADHATWHDA